MQIEINETEKKVLLDILLNKYENGLEMLESAVESEEKEATIKELKDYLSTLYEILLKIGPEVEIIKWDDFAE